MASHRKPTNRAAQVGGAVSSGATRAVGATVGAAASGVSSGYQAMSGNGTLGVVLATGGIVLLNKFAADDWKKEDLWQIGAATAGTAVVFHLLEGVLGSAAVLVAWTMAITAMIMPVGTRQAPVTTLSNLFLGK